MMTIQGREMLQKWHLWNSVKVAAGKQSTSTARICTSNIAHANEIVIVVMLILSKLWKH
jgi:hypothetical protein